MQKIFSYILKTTKYSLYSLRSIFAFITIGIAYIFLCNYLKNKDYIEAEFIIIFLLFPITLFLCIKQFKRDIIHLRHKYALHLYNATYENINIAKPNSSYNINTDPSLEILWDNYYSKSYRNLRDYLNHFLERNDPLSNRMKCVYTKSNMLKAIQSSQNYVQSIRVWEDQQLISLNFSKRIPIEEILSFDIVNEPITIKGIGHIKTISRMRGNSQYIGIGKYMQSAKTKHHSTICCDPDTIVNRYSLYLSVKNTEHLSWNMIIGNNQYLAQEIKSLFIYLGVTNQQIKQSQ